MARTYHTIFSKAKGDDTWSAEFGDYSKAVVTQEVRDMKESGSYVRGTKLIVWTHPDTQTDYVQMRREVKARHG